jgi:hypothetical protein
MAMADFGLNPKHRPLAKARGQAPQFEPLVILHPHRLRQNLILGQ